MSKVSFMLCTSFSEQKKNIKQATTQNFFSPIRDDDFFFIASSFNKAGDGDGERKELKS